MPKKEIHPKWYPNAKVICNGEVVMEVGATQPEIRVEVWSGNHPFFTGQNRIVDTEGQVDRFYKRLQARQDYVKAKEEREEARVSPDRSIEELNVSKRVIDTLAKANITNVGEFLEKLELGDDVVLEIDGYGRKSLADTKKALRQLGYTLPEN
jgi:large subunit ribosomal protein L31